MINKMIHYCWFGGKPLPDLALHCIASWSKYCPDYEIIEWNERNFDINYNDYVREAYEAGKWAFVSDVVRLYALVNYGGIYMDTDVEVLKPLDNLLEFEAVSGFETEERILTGIMACEKGQSLFRELLDEYNTIHFKDTDGKLDLTPNTARITATCLKCGLELNNTKQTIKGFTLFPSDYFCPKNCDTGLINITDNTYTIHHFDGSWLSEEEAYIYKLSRYLKKRLPKRAAGYSARFIGIVKFRGLRHALIEVLIWLKRKNGRKT